MKRYDIAIIGTGPAGLEAAITAKIRNKDILLIGGEKTLSQKVTKAHTVRNYLGLKEISGEEMEKAFAEHLRQMDIAVTRDRVTCVYAMGKYFAIQGSPDMYEALSVILACGMENAKPFPGEAENLGRGVSYCATCDGALYKGKTVIVIGDRKEEEKEALFLAELAEKVYYLPLYEGVSGTLGDNKIEVIINAKPEEIKRKDGRLILTYDKGSLTADGIFILRESVAYAQLVPGLHMDKNQVTVGRDMGTNIKGLFACGDITGGPYQYIKAAGEGSVAALSAVKYLDHIPQGSDQTP